MLSSYQNSCYQGSIPQGFQVVYGMDNEYSSAEAGSGVQSLSDSLLYSVSVLKDRVHQVRSLVSLVICPDNGQPESVAPAAIDGIGTLVQEIIVTASSLLLSYQQVAVGAADADKVYEQGFNTDQGGRPCWYGDNSNNNNDYHSEREQGFSRLECEIIELDVSDILAKYTHYCHICGKGFKRDANLRMHMRAHGDEYKSNAALRNPLKYGSSTIKSHRKYSCPQEGCRWNKKHSKFQPLKTMICVKNHYKRSHCPKMYVCNQCNQKQFSVISDLRTHQKHCGDTKWQCSCGTTFSRKDKLKNHVALFFGHSHIVANPV